MAGERDLDMTGEVAGLLLHVLRQTGNDLEQRDALAVEPLAGGRHREMRGVTLDQAAPHMSLEPLQRVADGRLRKRKLFARSGEPAFLHDHHEGSQQVPVDFPDEAASLLCHAHHSPNLCFGPRLLHRAPAS